MPPSDGPRRSHFILPAPVGEAVRRTTQRLFLATHCIILHRRAADFRHVIASPAFHRWHHSKDTEAWDKNFAALFPVWDVLFGTFYLPRGKRPGNFGIHDSMPKSLWGQLTQPFRQAKSDLPKPAPSANTTTPV